MKLNKIRIKTTGRKYSIIIGYKLAENLSKLIKENNINFNKCLIVIDKKIPQKKIKEILLSMKNRETILYYYSASELNKDHKNVNKILDILLKNNFNRNDCLISVGGGITGDVSAYASSIFKRGLKFINVPTTLLSQVDSSIGGKTGINTKYGKNSVGSFYQPHLVISDISFLNTLPQREITCGYGEILKHSLIADRKFFTFLKKNGSKVLKLKSPFINKAIYQSCIIKKKVVQLDEKETGLRKILNFGHTFGHAYEATLGFSKKLNHGEAIILGIVSAIEFSKDNNLLNNKEFGLIFSHLEKLNLPNNIRQFFLKKDLIKILSFMKKDKKNSSYKINLVLLKKIGKAIYNKNFDNNKINLFLKKLIN